MRFRRPAPIVLSALAMLAAIGAVILIALLSGVSLHRTFAHVHAGWFAVVAIAEGASLIPYTLAYRKMTAMAGPRPPRLRVLITVVMSGFGPFLLGGGFHLDQKVLTEVYGDHQQARVGVAALVALEWAVLSPAACASAIVLLIEGAGVMQSLLWPWALLVPAGFTLGLILSAPKHGLTVNRLPVLAGALEGIGTIHQLIRSPGRTSPAWAGMALYWAAEIVAVDGALHMFGVDLSPLRVILAYATGYMVTRRSLPLAGAIFTEVLLTFALHWVGAPLGPALAAVVVYRLFNLILAAVPSFLARRLLEPAIAAEL
ncbi:MAG TPA: hypothetical protein VFN65_05855 [Solirubrobacteraceae bacterium]|nr:hypothetical protein [Solirubrobacteraceae bacterium]